MSKTIIGLAGPKRSGKTSAALNLVKSGFVRYSFAMTIRNMITVMLLDLGYDQDEITRLLTVDKEMEIKELGMSPRELMQTLGTEWGRDSVDSDLWIKTTKSRIQSCADDYIVFDDVRFDNEANLIRELGGLIIHIDRGDLVQDDDHASEQGITVHPNDVIVNNDYALDDFLLDVSTVVAGFIGR